MKTKRLRELMRHLRRELPTDRPVRVRQIKRVFAVLDGENERSELFGLLLRYADHYTLLITSTVSDEYGEEIIVHEWAHILAWHEQDRDGIKEPHCHRWGRKYALVYRTVFGKAPDDN